MLCENVRGYECLNMKLKTRVRKNLHKTSRNLLSQKCKINARGIETLHVHSLKQTQSKKIGLQNDSFREGEFKELHSRQTANTPTDFLWIVILQIGFAMRAWPLYPTRKTVMHHQGVGLWKMYLATGQIAFKIAFIQMLHTVGIHPPGPLDQEDLASTYILWTPRLLQRATLHQTSIPQPLSLSSGKLGVRRSKPSSLGSLTLLTWVRRWCPRATSQADLWLTNSVHSAGPPPLAW